ncbi:MAG: signal recognition particle-docking protein FtsY [Candidatus Edwardsbacteria bacterium]
MPYHFFTYLRKVRSLLQGKRALEPQVLESLQEILIEADVGIVATNRIIQTIKKKVGALNLTPLFVSEIKIILKNELIHILQNSNLTPASDATIRSPTESSDLFASESHRFQRGPANLSVGQACRALGRRPTGKTYGQEGGEEKGKGLSVFLFVGVNGTGKTTTIAKLSNRLKGQGKKVVLAAADTYRAAAQEQLRVWTKRVGAEMIPGQMGADSAAVAYDALKSALAKKADFLLIDTAGRMHTKTPFLGELKKIYRVINKNLPEAPQEIFLVLDATTGQNALSQARLFKEAIPVTGVVLTKLDGTAKGGIIFAISEELKIPVKLIGTGEDLEDLHNFNAEQFVDAIIEGSSQKLAAEKDR